MKHKELITELSGRLELPSDQVEQLMKGFFSVISSRLVEQDTISLQGFGQFEAKKKSERVSVNPTNGKRYLIPPKLAPVFKPGTTVKGKLKDLSNHE